MILGSLIDSWLNDHRRSSRALARQLKLNHTTLRRFINGEKIESDKFAVVLDWALTDDNNTVNQPPKETCRHTRKTLQK